MLAETSDLGIIIGAAITGVLAFTGTVIAVVIAARRNTREHDENRAAVMGEFGILHESLGKVDGKVDGLVIEVQGQNKRITKLEDKSEETARISSW